MVLAPLLFRYTNRFPFDRQQWRPRLALHLAAGAAVILLLHGWKAWVDPRFVAGPGGPPPRMDERETSAPAPGFRPPLGRRPVWDLVYLGTFQLPIYLMIICAAHAALFYRRDRDRESSLTKARLEALTAQLQPHFLFNTLNTIAELVHEDPDRADAMITALSEMLRLTLDVKAAALVPLQHETAFIERYFRIMQMRFGERLKYECEIEPRAHAGMVPRFILQPLVENAIRHGLDPKPAGGVVRISGRVEHGRLHLSVSDNGVGLAEPALREGLGLANTRARLHEFFQGAATVTVREENGVVVEVTLPYRIA